MSVQKKPIVFQLNAHESTKQEVVISSYDMKKEKNKTLDSDIFKVEADEQYPYLFKKEIKEYRSQIFRIYMEAKINTDKEIRKKQIKDLRKLYVEDPKQYYEKWRWKNYNLNTKQLDCLEKSFHNFNCLYQLILIIGNFDKILDITYLLKHDYYNEYYELELKIDVLKEYMKKIYNGASVEEKKEMDKILKNLEDLETSYVKKNELLGKIESIPPTRELKQNLKASSQVRYDQEKPCHLNNWNNILKKCKILDAQELYELLPRKKYDWWYESDEYDDEDERKCHLIHHPCDCENCLNNLDKIVETGLIPIQDHIFSKREEKCYPSKIRDKLNKWLEITDWDKQKDILENIITILSRSKSILSKVTSLFGGHSFEDQIILSLKSFKFSDKENYLSKIYEYLKNIKEEIETSAKKEQNVIRGSQFFYSLAYLVGKIQREHQVELLAAKIPSKVSDEDKPHAMIEVSEIIAGYTGRW